jgi:hypothetical protein
MLMQESAKIYCLCRQPYDELRPMLSCDHCNDWFHYDCIGLQPPGDNEDDDEVAPAEYRCPKCCIQVGYAAGIFSQHHISNLLALPEKHSSCSLLADRLLSASLEWMYHTLKVTHKTC